MLPRIQFGSLICTYLPGLALSLSIFFEYYEAFNKFSETIGLETKTTIIIGFFVFIPLVLGLFIDGIRHLLELATDYYSKKKKAYSKLSIFWCDITRDEIEKSKHLYPGEFTSMILGISETYYSIYEFFWNLLISTWIAMLYLLCSAGIKYSEYLNICAGIICLSFGGAMIFKALGNKLKNQYLRLIIFCEDLRVGIEVALKTMKDWDKLSEKERNSELNLLEDYNKSLTKCETAIHELKKTISAMLKWVKNNKDSEDERKSMINILKNLLSQFA